jgi:hypothetical protein
MPQGYAGILGYKIYWDQSNGEYEHRVTLNAASITSYVEASVTQGLSYNFKISALNSYGEGPLSDAVLIIPAWVPDAPLNVVMTSSDSS